MQTWVHRVSNFISALVWISSSGIVLIYRILIFISVFLGIYIATMYSHASIPASTTSYIKAYSLCNVYIAIFIGIWIKYQGKRLMKGNSVALLRTPYLMYLQQGLAMTYRPYHWLPTATHALPFLLVWAYMGTCFDCTAKAIHDLAALHWILYAKCPHPILHPLVCKEDREAVYL